MLQFVCESLMVSLVGASIGIVLRAVFVHALMAQLNIIFNYFVFFASLIGSVGGGVVRGVIPAEKAGRLDPVDAMRFE